MLVTDLSMPGGGMDLIQRVASATSARVLVFSMHDSAPLVQRAIEAGARGYIPKSSPPECLVEGVRALHAGRRYLAPELPANCWPHATRCPSASGWRSLSAREFEVFRLLAQGQSAGECAAALNLSAKTVSNHQSAIKDKLGVATSAALVHLAIRHGVIEPSAL